MLDLANLQAPIETANGLPNTCYIDPAMYQHEQNTLFRDSWVAVGFGKDVPQSGCVKPVNFAGLPMLLVRNQDGNINVFQNVCRHRGINWLILQNGCAAQSPAPITLGPMILTVHRARLRMKAVPTSTRMTRLNIVTIR